MGRKDFLDDFSDEEIMDLDMEEDEADDFEDETGGGRGRWLFFVIPSAVLVVLLIFAGVKLFKGKGAQEEGSPVFTEVEAEPIEEKQEEPIEKRQEETQEP